MLNKVNKQEFFLSGELLLLCERMEMARFLRVYLHHLFRQGLMLPKVQFYCYRSMEQLPLVVEQLPAMDGSGQVRKVVLFADAGDNVDARRNIMDIVRDSAFLATREYCAHFFFPGKGRGRRWRKGCLEDLLLEALAEADTGMQLGLLNVAREYLFSVDNVRGKMFPQSGRRLLHTYLAGTEEYAGLSLSEAAQAGAFNLDSAALAGLRSCFAALVDKTD